MKHTVTGWVMRRVKVGEADLILTLLTPRQGIISASAKGALRPKSKIFSAAGLYGFSEWTLFEGRSMYQVDEASSIEVFFGLRNSLEGISLAGYFSEILQILTPTDDEAARLLRMTLNCLYLLAEEKQEPRLVKAVFELRALAESGFLPDVTSCAACGAEQADPWFFDARQGTLLCVRCGGQAAAVQALPLNQAAFMALRHILHSDMEQLFAFQVGPATLNILSRVAEEYLLCSLEHPPRSLAFLNDLLKNAGAPAVAAQQNDGNATKNDG